MAEKSGGGGRFLLLYGSQTGQAEVISELIRDEAITRGFQPDRHCLDQSEKKFQLEKEEVFVVVVSTTGEGDPPDNVTKFWRRLKKKTLPHDHLAGCNYALLGLGDSNYTNFCNMGKVLNKRLLDLGARQFHAPGFADDGVGLDIVVEPWISGLWEPLAKILQPGRDLTDSEAGSGTKVNSEAGSGTKVNSEAGSGTKVNSEADSGTKVNSEAGSGTKVVSEYADSTKNTAQELNISGHDSVDTNARNTDREDGSEELTNASSVSTSKLSDGGKQDSTEDNKLSSHIADLSISSPASPPTHPYQDPATSSVTSALSLSGEEGRLLVSDSNRSSSVDPAMPPATSLLGKVGGRGLVSGPNSSSSCIRDEGRWSAMRNCSSDLIGSSLALPSLPTAYISVKISDGLVPAFPHREVSHGIKSPPISLATISASRVLTKDGARKTTLEIELKVPGLNYDPGDAFGFVCPNAAEEVEWLLQRLCLSEEADKMMELSIIAGTTKKNASLPKHVPKSCSVRQFFTHCAGIRSIPKKVHLKLLSTFCLDEKECRRLEELSSKQGSKEYSLLFTDSRADFLDVFFTFPSCQPPLHRLIEIIPKLQPRYYSAASSPLSTPGRLKVVFNVEQLPARFWSSGGLDRERLGLASGWLEKVAQLTQLKDQDQEVPIFPRTLISNPFHLPGDSSHAIVMIGPGTGVSPFVGFLKHRETLIARTPSNSLGKAWLLFGCRNPDLDHIYEEEMKHFRSVSCLSQYHVAYSRLSPSQEANLFPTPLIPPMSDKTNSISNPGRTSLPLNNEVPHPKYVQDLVRLHWKELGSWLVEDKSYVYICGDAKNMVADVKAALLDVLDWYLASEGNRTSFSPESLLEASREEGRYLVDAWS